MAGDACVWSPQAEGGVALPPLPAVWMEDLRATSLEARCSLTMDGSSSSSSSGSSSGSSSDDGGISSIADMVQQSLAEMPAPNTALAVATVAAAGVPPPAAAAFAAANGSSGVAVSTISMRTRITLGTLLQMLHNCVRGGGAIASSSSSSSSSNNTSANNTNRSSVTLEASGVNSVGSGSSSSSSSTAQVAIAVSATHLRVAYVTDALLLANISGRVRPAFQTSAQAPSQQQEQQQASAVADALAAGAAAGEPSDGSSSSSSSTALAAGALAGLLVAPGGRFGLRLQLHDGLGQPVAVGEWCGAAAGHVDAAATWELNVTYCGREKCGRVETAVHVCA